MTYQRRMFYGPHGSTRVVDTQTLADSLVALGFKSGEAVPDPNPVVSSGGGADLAAAVALLQDKATAATDAELAAAVATLNTALAGKQDASTAATDAELAAAIATVNAKFPAFSPGQRVGFTNVSTTGSQGTVATSAGTAKDTGLTVVIPAGITGAALTLKTALTLAHSVANGMATIQFVEVANGTDTPVNFSRVVNLSASAGGFVAFEAEMDTRINATPRQRTWNLQITNNSGSGAVTMYVPTGSGSANYDCYATGILR